jgi:geranylgeranyl diphosphate synthase, type II
VNSQAAGAHHVDVRALLAREGRLVDAALAGIAAEHLGEEVPEAAAARHSLAAGGKRLRPVLCIACYRAIAAADATPHHYRFAAAIELIHTYSLIHDDLPAMDNDDMRRGQATAHRVFGVPAALLGAAALIPLAAAVLDEAGRALGLASQVRMGSIQELASAAGAGGMVGGQQLDLVAEGHALDLPGLERVHRRKTGALFRASARLGGLPAGAGAREVDALGEYAEELGLAFQIADDVLDVTALSEALGKTAGKDVRSDKATFPGLLGLDGARAHGRAAVRRAGLRLQSAGIASLELEALTRFAMDRDR